VSISRGGWENVMADQDLIVLNDGRTILGDIAEDVFSLRDEALGRVDHRQDDIAWIIRRVYGRDGQDEMTLHNQTRYLGELVNDTITITVPGADARRVATRHIRVLKFNFIEGM
jgi:hypothetical protein